MHVPLEVGVHGSIGGTGDLASVMSYNSTNTSSSQGSVSAKASLQPQQLGTKVSSVHWFLFFILMFSGPVFQTSLDPKSHLVSKSPHAGQKVKVVW